MVHTLVSASCGWITDILLTVCLSLAYDICLHQETTPKRQAFQSQAIINSLSCQSSLSSSTFKHIHELPDVTPARVQMASWTTFFFLFLQQDKSSSSCSEAQGATVQQEIEDWKLQDLWNQLPKARFHPGNILYSTPGFDKSSNTDKYVLRIGENTFYLLDV